MSTNNIEMFCTDTIHTDISTSMSEIISRHRRCRFRKCDVILDVTFVESEWPVDMLPFIEMTDCFLETDPPFETPHLITIGNESPSVTPDSLGQS